MRFSKSRLISFIFLLLCFSVLFPPEASAQEDPQTRHYQRVLRPVMVTHCFDCHNGGDKKAGLNLEDVYFASSIIRNGGLWVKVIEQIKSEKMPPHTKPRIPEADKQLLIGGIEALLDSALSIPDPGRIVMRRLSNREYRYTVLDLTGVEFDAPAFFPADASGGEGFDNHANALYITPLQMERYLQAADTIVTRAYKDPALWEGMMPATFQPGFFQSTLLSLKTMWDEDDATLEAARNAAAEVLYPFATRAYRRFLEQDEKDQLLKVFTTVYAHVKDEEDAFNRCLQETLKYILVSPSFLYRREANVQSELPYEITGFELASRLSFFLWSSGPDQILLDAAYRDNLHDPDVLRAQLNRMLQDPRSIRMARGFAGQWLEVEQLLGEHQVDPSMYPMYTPSLRQAMYDETVLFFHHIITTKRSLLDVLDSDYTFLNEELAVHYGIENYQSSTNELQLTHLSDTRRGGVLGQGGILTVTSLPTRTSPVLRGKWVLEQLLGTPPPPPPPDVPELAPASDKPLNEQDLRAILSRHRAPSTCFGCHQKMDPLGLGLENFDAVGKWRNSYGEYPVDASGELPGGTTFEGPAALRQILLKEQASYATNLSRKMLAYALGRSIRFQDKKTIDALTGALFEHAFDTEEFLFTLVNSYPFRYRKSDIM